MAIFGSAKGKTVEPAKAVPPPGGLSIIAVGMTVRGDIDSNGVVKVEGAVDGHVSASNQVLVARGGVVQGDVAAREAIVGGRVQGAIHATERVEIQAGAAVEGDITTRRIAVAEGGRIDGTIRMAEGAEAKAEGREPRPQQAFTRPSVPVARVAVPPRQPAGGSGY